MTEKWRIVVGADDAGMTYKDALKADLEADPRVAAVIDVGVSTDERTRPYPRGRRGRRRRSPTARRTAALLVCGTGWESRSAPTRFPASERSPRTTASPSSGRAEQRRPGPVLRAAGGRGSRSPGGSRERLGDRFDAASASAAKIAVIGRTTKPGRADAVDDIDCRRSGRRQPVALSLVRTRTSRTARESHPDPTRADPHQKEWKHRGPRLQRSSGLQGRHDRGFVSAYTRYVERVPDASGGDADGWPACREGERHHRRRQRPLPGVLRHGRRRAGRRRGDRRHLHVAVDRAGLPEWQGAGRRRRGAVQLRELRRRRDELRCRRRSGCGPRASTAGRSWSPTTSHPPRRDQDAKRRGVVGDFVVFKVAGAAADRGDPDRPGGGAGAQGERRHRAAFGVAFDGCTFRASRSRCSGSSRARWSSGSASTGAGNPHRSNGSRPGNSLPVLLEPLLAERLPRRTARPEPPSLLNGLGATKYEELFCCGRHSVRLLTRHGIEPVLPEVGEIVTSLDMAGCSLTLTWLDDELEELWTAPADTPAFRRGSVADLSASPRATGPHRTLRRGDSSMRDTGRPAGSGVVREAISAMLRTVLDNEEELGRIDAVAGDGDHGVGMVRGLRAADAAAAGALEAGAGASGTAPRGRRGLGGQGRRVQRRAWGAILTAIGSELGDTAAPERGGDRSAPSTRAPRRRAPPGQVRDR